MCEWLWFSFHAPSLTFPRLRSALFIDLDVFRLVRRLVSPAGSHVSVPDADCRVSNVSAQCIICCARNDTRFGTLAARPVARVRLGNLAQAVALDALFMWVSLVLYPHDHA